MRNWNNTVSGACIMYSGKFYGLHWRELARGCKERGRVTVHRGVEEHVALYGNSGLKTAEAQG